jgi:hypothetical protein
MCWQENGRWQKPNSRSPRRGAVIAISEITSGRGDESEPEQPATHLGFDAADENEENTSMLAL